MQQLIQQLLSKNSSYLHYNFFLIYFWIPCGHAGNDGITFPTGQLLFVFGNAAALSGFQTCFACLS